MNSWFIFVYILYSLNFTIVLVASTVNQPQQQQQLQQREIPSQINTGSYTTFNQQQQQQQSLLQNREMSLPQTNGGSYTSVYSTYSDPNTNTGIIALEKQGNNNNNYGYTQYSPQQSQYGQYTPQPNQQYGSYKDPGFSMQTGFEGFLVPNPLYSVAPWGIETILIVIVGIVVFVAFKIGILFFLIKILKIGKLFKSDENSDVRSYIPSFINKNYLSDLASSVFNAIDRYNEVSLEDDNQIKTTLK